MPIPPPPVAPNSITVTALDLIMAALTEIGVQAMGEQLANEDAAWALSKLQRLIDRYNARDAMVYNVEFFRFTLPVATQPVLIGPGGNGPVPPFQTNQRPVRLYSASLILTGTSPEVEIPIYVRDDQWWSLQAVKTLPSTLPTDVYFSPGWPNGSLYFWPVPTQVNDVRLEMRTVLTEIASYNQSFSMPPGYWDAIVYPLAVSLCPSFERQASSDLMRLSSDAVKAIQTNNMKSPRSNTADAGMPGNDIRGGFNYYSGMPSQR